MIEQFDSEYLIFVRQPQVVQRKTCSWAVESKSGHTLGMIHWYGPWRQYCFFPQEKTIFNRGCLLDIVRFCLDMHEVRSELAA